MNGQVAYYSFDGTTTDGSGNANNLTSTGTTSLVVDRKNQLLKATGFGGVSSVGYHAASNNATLQFSAGFSVSFWYKIGTYAEMDGYGASVANGYQIFMAKEGDRAGFYIGVSNDVANNRQSLNFTSNVNNVTNFNISASPTGTAATNINKWIHLTATAGNGEVKIYLDGILKTIATVASFNFSAMNTKNLYLGTSQALGTHWYTYSGSLDEVHIYNRAISATEVLTIYNAEK